MAVSGDRQPREELDGFLGPLRPQVSTKDVPSKHLAYLGIEKMRGMQIAGMFTESLADLTTERRRVEKEVDDRRGVEDDHPASRIARTAVALSSDGFTDPAFLIAAMTSSIVGRRAYLSTSRSK